MISKLFLLRLEIRYSVNNFKKAINFLMNICLPLEVHTFFVHNLVHNFKVEEE